MVWQVVQEYGASINLDPTPMHILYGHRAGVTSVDVSNELDLVVSGSVDGTVNMHTLRAGCYVRTLSFADTANIASFRTINVRLSNYRHMLVYVRASLADQPDELLKSNRQSKVNRQLDCQLF
jgi:WD40 repeat protein